MFKRRRNVAATAGTGLPFCAMCGQGIRVDVHTGRCALGHRVATAPVAVAVPTSSPDHGDLAPAAYGETTDTRVGDDVFAAVADDFDRYSDTIVWEPTTPAAEPVPALNADVLDEFIAWEQPGGGTFSALDVDTNELPMADASAAFAAAGTAHDLGSDLLDELDDATHARRQAVGTIGATIALSGMVFVAVAALPF